MTHEWLMHTCSKITCVVTILTIDTCDVTHEWLIHTCSQHRTRRVLMNYLEGVDSVHWSLTLHSSLLTVNESSFTISRTDRHVSMSEYSCEWDSAYVNASVLMWMSQCSCEESVVMWMSQCSYEWVSTHVNETVLMWMSQCLCECVSAYVDESVLMWMSQWSCGWVSAHMNESVLIWMSEYSCEWDSAYVNESVLMWMSQWSCEWVSAHVNESSFTTSRTDAHVSMVKKDMTHSYETWLLHMRHDSFTHMRYDAFVHMRLKGEWVT